MKKYSKFLVPLITAFSLMMTGCQAADEAGSAATKSTSEVSAETEASAEASAEASTESSVDDSSSQLQSTVVIKDLFEPELDETASEAGSAASVTDVAATATSIERDSLVEIVVFGDSQMANGRNDGSDISNLMSMRVPNAKVYNLAIGGTTCSLEKSTQTLDPSAIKSTSFVGMTYCLSGKSDRNATLANYPDVLNAMNAVNPADVDYYVIEYGANDFLSEVPLDTSMYEADQLHAFYNAMCVGVDILKSISPDAKIIIMMPFYGVYADADGGYIGDSYVVSNGIGTLSDYAKKSQNVAEDKQCIIFDDMFKTKCDLYLDTASAYLIDNLHLNLTGRQIFARLLAHQINYEEHNEPFAYLDTDFIKIAEFDPNETYRYDEGQMREYYPESWEKYIKGEFPLAQPSEEALKLYGNQG